MFRFKGRSNVCLSRDTGYLLPFVLQMMSLWFLLSFRYQLCHLGVVVNLTANSIKQKQPSLYPLHRLPKIQVFERKKYSIILKGDLLYPPGSVVSKMVMVRVW